ncbi:ATP-binding cassette domain-containing protein [Salibacteraceae bacterium]|jgi:ABC-type bacteriocin/lantibiotic exporter with double-glycine peptidase domain|nr:ATP-binding cassette domain-containing protein [Salibacteraceae bacterium]
MSETLTPTQRFWKLLKPDSKEIRDIYVYSIFNGLVALTLPLGIQAIINLIQGGQISTSWVVLVTVVVLGVAISGVLQIFQLRLTENLQQKIFARAAFEFAYRMPRIRMEALYKHYAPELMNRFFDTISVQKGLSKILIDFSSASLQLVFGLLLLSVYHPFFILFSLILVFLVYAIFNFTARRGLTTSLKESKQKYLVVHWLEEVARTSTTFKLAGKSNLPLRRTDEQTSEYLTAREGHYKVLVQQYWMLATFRVLVAAGLLILGGILVMEQLMNIGQFVAAEIIILLVLSSAEKLILSLETIYDVLTSLEKIGQVTDLELEKSEGMDMRERCTDEGMSVELKDVSFKFPDQHDYTLRDVSVSINSGERLLITGTNGSGKSTLLTIIAGLYSVQKGSVSYNNLPKGNLILSTLHSVIGDYLTQQEELFEGTVMENIRMGRDAATYEHVKWAVDNLGLTDFIQSLPLGYDTIFDAQAKRLPRSVVQKMLIARAIADRPSLLLLEDAFEHLDEFERRRIIDFLTEKDKTWTVVVVSNDPYMAQRSDRLVVMKEGKVAAIGTYEEIKKSGTLKSERNA